MALERKIAEILKDDARRTPAQIAAMLGEDETTVKSCIRAMEESGKIVKYTAIVEETDESGVEALIEVKVTPKKGEGFDGIARDIAEMPEVKGVYLMSGAYDLAIFLEGTTLQRVAQFVAERISTFDGVLSTATHFILKKYKIEGVVTEKTPKDNRLSVQP
jgi:DNA-binding Lrp family transcriptional regulator